VGSTAPIRCNHGSKAQIMLKGVSPSRKKKEQRKENERIKDYIA
jgi:hypothetical protein